MVRRLIEHEEVRPAEYHHCECDARPLPTGERLSASLGLISRETETSEMTLHLPALPVWAQLADDIEEAAVHRHLRHVLPVVAGTNRSSDPKLSAGDLALSDERAQECGFSTSVGANKPDYFAALNRGGEISDEGAPFHSQCDIPSDDHLVTASLRHVKPEAHGTAFLRCRAAQPRHSAQAFASSFCLLRILTGNGASDVIFFVRDDLPLLVGRPLLTESSFFALSDE